MTAPADPAPPPAPPRRVARKVLRLPNPMAFLVWGTLFVPGHLADWWVERLFALTMSLVAALTIFGKPAAWETRRAVRLATGFLAMIQFLFVTSFVYAVAFNGLETGPRDYFEAGRYVFLWLFVVYLIRHHDDRVTRATEAAGTVCLYWSLLVAVCYLRDVPALTPFFRYTLYAHTKTFVNYFGTLRLSAPFENPNFLGFFAAQFLSYLVFFSRSPLRLAHIAACLLVVYFTGSRTAWVTASIVLLAAFATYLYMGALKARLKFALQLMLALVLFGAAGARLSGKVMENSRLKAIFSAIHRGGVQNEANAAGRLEQNAQVWEYFKRSPVLGWGPSKYATFDYVDNQYALWFLRNGAVGALLILAALGATLLRFLRSRPGGAVGTAGLAAQAMVVGVALLTGEFLNNFRLFYITWFIGMAAARGGRPGPDKADAG